MCLFVPGLNLVLEIGNLHTLVIATSFPMLVFGVSTVSISILFSDISFIFMIFKCIIELSIWSHFHSLFIFLIYQVSKDCSSHIQSADQDIMGFNSHTFDTFYCFPNQVIVLQRVLRQVSS